MKHLMAIFMLVFAASFAFAQKSSTGAPIYTKLVALGDNDPKGNGCGEYFRIAKVKKTEKIVFRLAGEGKAIVLPVGALSTVFVDAVTDVPQVNFLDLPGLSLEQGRMVMVLVSDKGLKAAPCLGKAGSTVHVVE